MASCPGAEGASLGVLACVVRDAFRSVGAHAAAQTAARALRLRPAFQSCLAADVWAARDADHSDARAIRRAAGHDCRSAEDPDFQQAARAKLAEPAYLDAQARWPRVLLQKVVRSREPQPLADLLALQAVRPPVATA